MTVSIRRVSALLMGTALACSGHASIRDYYEEPGLNPFKDTVNQNFGEHIDPFSGQLQLSYTDILVPGNGGFDLRVQRVYNNPQDAALPYSPYGYGWTMHFGRIAVDQQNNTKICNQNLWSVDVLDNPSLELPDGGRQLLVLADQHSPELITKQWWRADCEPDGDVVVKSPDGTKYVMDEWDTDAEGTKIYATYIEDANGNSMTIDYDVNPTGVIYVNSVTTSDGRSLDYAYENVATDNIRLKSIAVNGPVGGVNDGTWTYSHTYTTTTIPDYALLTKVTRPDGLSWDYDYHPNYTNGTAGSFAMEKVTYPSGGTIEYGYGYVYFDFGAQKATTVVTSKDTGGRDITPASWSFTYTPGHSSSSGYDETLMVAPDHQRLYQHVGYVASAPRWRVGTKDYETVYDLNGNPIEQYAYTYGSILLSNENFWHGRSTLRIDDNTQTPYVASVRHWRQGTSVETQYSNFDAYGNPQTVVETTNLIGASDRTITRTFQNNTSGSDWILGLVTQEIIDHSTNSTISQWTTNRTYDPAGNLETDNQWGVLTSYTYTSEGDLATVTDANSNTTTFTNYHRGIAKNVSYPESVTEVRSINDDGTIEYITNGRGYTTNYTWDDLNRLTDIDYPINSDVSISYYADKAVLTRGAYQETRSFDGFWRSTGMERKDAVLGTVVSTNRDVDHNGNVTFQSYPNSSQGVTFTYNGIEQLESVTNPDLSSRTYTYPNGSEVQITDENGHVTRKAFLDYGNMDSKLIRSIYSPELVTTLINYDGVNKPIMVFQGELQQDNTILGGPRYYRYDSRSFLVEEEHPETGITSFGRDNVGNLTSIEIGTSTIVETRTYDDLNRLETITYSDGTPGATFGYDGNSNLESVTSSVATRAYIYDQNDNLTDETLLIGGQTYDVAYGIDGLDQIGDLTYPSGRVVDFGTNAIGWQTKAGSYVTHVNHHPNGLLDTMTYANGVVTSLTLDNRQRPYAIGAQLGQTEYVDLTLGYDNVSNVTGIVDSLGTQHDRTIGYDDFDRMTSATGPWGTETVTYDAMSNIDTRDRNGDVQDYYYDGNMKLAYRVFPTFFYTVTHDARGNVTSDGPNIMLYDGANRLVTADNGVNVIDYEYDGAGTRVSRTQLLQTDHVLYNQSGQLLGEYNPSGGFTEYVYVDAALAAKIEDPTTAVGQ